jgi:hypothetical protein
MRLLVLTFFSASMLFGLQNTSLAKRLIGFQGDQYNVLLAPKQIVVTGKKKKTRKAINKGYKRAVSEMIRQLRLRGMDVNFKGFHPSLGDPRLPQYMDQDVESYTILDNLMAAQITVKEAYQDDAQMKQSSTEVSSTVQVSADDIDLDIDDSAFDISEETVQTKTSSGAIAPVNAKDAFRDAFREMSEQYNQEVLSFADVVHPFAVEGEPKMLNVHSVFGMGFFPTKNGAVKQIKIYVILCIINTEEADSVEIILKPIPTFRWDRNYLYISGATGKILRMIVSQVLGEPLLFISK